MTAKNDTNALTDARWAAIADSTRILPNIPKRFELIGGQDGIEHARVLEAVKDMHNGFLTRHFGNTAINPYNTKYRAENTRVENAMIRAEQEARYK